MNKFTLKHALARERAIEAVRRAPDGSVVSVSDGPIRSLDQNAKLWPMLTDISEQCLLHGEYQLSKEWWKDVFTAALVKEVKVVPNLDRTGFVMLGQRTSKMSKRMFSDLIELIYAYGSENGVVWSEKASQGFDEYL